MYAQKTSSPSSAKLAAVNNKVTRLFIDENLPVKASPAASERPYSCRCTETKVDPSIMCPSHWLSSHLQFPDAIH